MQQESAVGNMDECDIGQRFDGFDNRLRSRIIARRHRDVAHELIVANFDNIYRANVPARFANRRSNMPEDTGFIGEF